MNKVITLPRKVESNYINLYNEFLRKNNLEDTQEVFVHYYSFETEASRINHYKNPAVMHSISTFPVDESGKRFREGIKADIAMVRSNRFGERIVPMIGDELAGHYIMCQLFKFYEKLTNFDFNPAFFIQEDEKMKQVDFESRLDEIIHTLEEEFEPKGLRNHEFIIINDPGLVELSFSDPYDVA